MILVSWNCAGALRSKFQSLAKLDADIYVVQECEDPARSTNESYRQWASNHLWVGKNKNSGLGVFARSDVRLEMLPLDSGRLELFLACRINDAAYLLAVWTKQANSPTFQYIGQLWKFIELHRQSLSGGPLIVAGDLNSNVRWDKWDRWWNHTDVVREIGALGSESAYHHARCESQGAESEPTFFLQRKAHKPYHIDYVFVPASWLPGCSVSIGALSDWIDLSDHMPLKVSLRSSPFAESSGACEIADSRARPIRPTLPVAS